MAIPVRREDVDEPTYPTGYLGPCGCGFIEPVSPPFATLPRSTTARPERSEDVTTGFEDAAMAVLRQALGPSAEFRDDRDFGARHGFRQA